MLRMFFIRTKFG